MTHQKLLLEVTKDQINTLQRQEESAYRCSDYLYSQSQDKKYIPTTSSLESILEYNTNDDSVMDETWREKICDWCYSLIDYFNYDREYVFVTMNFLDRYVMKRQVDSKTYQLAAITSLFIVIKINEPRSYYSTTPQLDITSFVKLSQNKFDAKTILSMEREILETLEWHLFPPTPNKFIGHLSNLVIPQSNSCDALQELKEVARFLTELIVCDYFFVTHKPSTISIASMLHAIDVVGEEHLPSGFKESLIQTVFQYTGINCNVNCKLQECVSRLELTYIREGMFSKKNQQQTSSSTTAVVEDDEEQETPIQKQCMPSPVSCVQVLY
jgi:hypothetical protein